MDKDWISEPGSLSRENCGPDVEVGIRTSVGKGLAWSVEATALFPSPASVGVDVKLGTGVIVGVWLGVVTTVGVEVSAGGGGAVGVVNKATTSLREQDVRTNIRTRL